MDPSILVPLDGSSFGEQALPLATLIAAGSSATLQLVHVREQDRPGPFPSADLLAADEVQGTGGVGAAQRYLAHIGARIAPQVEGRVTSVVITAQPGAAQETVARALSEHIAASHPALVVLTTHGRGGLARLWLGSVADQLVRQCHRPILIVRPSEPPAERSPRRTSWRFLLPLDGSALAEQIIAPAVALGRILRAEYTLLHVVSPSALACDTPIAEWAGGNDPDVVGRRRQVAERYLDGVAERMLLEGHLVRTRVVVSPHTAEAIIESAHAHGDQLIALATHGRGGRERLLLGSVADKVLRSAEVPRLLFRPQTDVCEEA